MFHPGLFGVDQQMVETTSTTNISTTTRSIIVIITNTTLISTAATTSRPLSIGSIESIICTRLPLPDHIDQAPVLEDHRLEHLHHPPLATTTTACDYLDHPPPAAMDILHYHHQTIDFNWTITDVLVGNLNSQMIHHHQEFHYYTTTSYQIHHHLQ